MANVEHALRGVTVLSLAEQYPGPLCTRLLSDMGAEVIQLERPTGGDPQRYANPWLFRFAGLGKKSVALDLKQPEALAAAKVLAQRCDALVEGYRPGVMQRLGLSYETVRQDNPKVVYCSMSGYGQDGPYRNLTGHNINYEAICGYMEPYVTGEYEFFPGGPPWGDVVSGALAAAGIAAGLRQAEITGLGSYLDISITDSLVFGIGGVLTRHQNGGATWPLRGGGYGLFACSDGHIVLGIAHEDSFWRALCGLIGIEQYSHFDHQERIDRRSELRVAIAERLVSETVGHWLEAMGDSIPASRVNRIADVADDPQIRDRDLFMMGITETGEPFRTVRSPFSERGGELRAVPDLGAFTTEALASLGLDISGSSSPLDDGSAAV